MTELRNTIFTGDAAQDAVLASENALDANAALRERIATTVVQIAYTAVGATTAKIPLKVAQRPFGVVLLNAWLATSPADDLGAVGRCNFVWDAATTSAYVFEPSGLTANTAYVLTFLVVG
jgi:hypothetical protein